MELQKLQPKEILKLIRKNLKEWAYQLGCKDDLVGIAFLAALEAAKNYDPQKGGWEPRLRFYINKRVSLYLKKEEAQRKFNGKIVLSLEFLMEQESKEDEEHDEEE